MKTYPGKAKPHGGRRGASGVVGREDLRTVAALYRGTERSPRLPHQWRDRLPDPARYYGQHVVKLSRPNATGWAQGQCPFHEDRNASLSVQVNDARGGWRCFAGCGGGDLVGFHMRLTGKMFADAVDDLLRGAA